MLSLAPPAALLAAVIVAVYGSFPASQGFDPAEHLDYLRYVDLTASLPLAGRGWQMYHPPAYYVLSAVTFEAFHRLGAGLDLTAAGRAVSTAAWVLQGAVAAAAARALGGYWLAMVAAGAVAWLLPAQSMVGTMVYNETLTGLGVALAVLGAALWRDRRPAGLLWLGIGLPLAALSKYSGLVAAAAMLPLLLWVGWGRLRVLAAALMPGLVLVVLFYLRNLITFGTPTPLNGELFHLRDWDPLGWGHPAGYFTKLDLGGCAAVDSFWGGFWKWFWVVDCRMQNLDAGPWGDHLEVWLLLPALLATAFAVAAAVWLLVTRRRDPAQLALALLPAALMASFLLYNHRLPSLTSNKGVYVLAAVVPLAVGIGLLVQRLASTRRRELSAYVLVLVWSALMAHASGVG